MLPPAPRYTRPPIIERVVSVWAGMDQEAYESSFEEWRDIVEGKFPVFEPLKQWLLNIKEDQGVPTEISPALDVTPRFSKLPSSGGFDWSIRCPSGQLTMNMHSSHAKMRGYSDLRECFSEWLPKWIDHFRVERFTDVSLHYVNLLNPQTLPTFWKDGLLELRDALNIFVKIPGTKDVIVKPFNCEVNMEIRGSPRGLLTIRAHDSVHKPQPSLLLDLIIKTDLKPNQTVSEILELADWCHDRVIERFEAIFTPEAKEYFNPLTP